MHCSCNFAGCISVRYDSKIAWISSLLHNIIDRKSVFTVNLSNLSVWFCFLSLLSQALLHFHLKEAFYGYFLPYLNSRHYNSHTLGPLLSRIRSICTQTPWNCNQLSIWQPWRIVSDWWVSVSAHSLDKLDNGMIMSLEKRAGRCKIVSLHRT